MTEAGVRGRLKAGKRRKEGGALTMLCYCFKDRGRGREHSPRQPVEAEKARKEVLP